MEANLEQLYQQVISERESCLCFGAWVFFFSCFSFLERPTIGVLAVSSLNVRLHLNSASLTVSSYFVLVSQVKIILLNFWFSDFTKVFGRDVYRK